MASFSYLRSTAIKKLFSNNCMCYILDVYILVCDVKINQSISQVITPTKCKAS